MKVFLKRLLAAPFVFVATVIMLLEDWLWDDLQRIAAAIGRLPFFRQFESFLVGLPPYAALAMFATPSLLLIPVKLAALWFIAQGQPALGFFVAVAAKVAGTALIARLYTLMQNNLLRIGWFAALHAWLIAFKARIYGRIKATAIYRTAHSRYLRLKISVKAFLQKQGRGFWKRRWEAAIKLSRRWKLMSSHSRH